MPVNPTYPGVYIQELASDVRTIVPVETATAAFVGKTLRGLPDTPTIVFGFAEFERVFGGLSNESKLGFAVRDFFLNGGTKAVIVRAFREDTGGTRPTRASLQLVAPAPPSGTPADPARLAADLAEAASKASVAEAKAEAKEAEAAALEQLAQALEALSTAKAIEIPRLKLEAPKLRALADAAQGEADAATGEAREAARKKADAAKTKADAAEAALKAADAAAPTLANDAAEARTNANNAKGPATAARKEATDAANAVDIARAKVAAGGAVNLTAASQGSWGDQLVLRVTTEDDSSVREQLARRYRFKTADPLFNLRIRDKATGEEEYYPNVTLVEGPRRLDRVLAEESRLVRVSANALDGYQGPAPMANGKPAAGEDWWESEGAFYKVSGETSDGLLGSDAGEDDKAIMRAIDALDQTDIFNMLCIPPYNDADEASSDVIAHASAYCTRRRAILLVDPPANWDSVDDAVKGFPTEVISPTSNAAIYFPRLRQRNPLRENQAETFVPCGAIAGVIARTDFRRGVWKAPAGLEATINGIVGLSVAVDDNQNGLLNPKGVNCLRVMPAAGPVVWGARTTEGDDRLASQWKYLPVRRMALWIEETLYRSTQWAVFEPNDEPLWSSLRLNIGNFMNGLYRQGAFQGRTPAEAFFVQCDASTTTQTDIDRGIVNVIVGFAPLKPAEFVIISIKQITNQGAAA